MLNPVRPLSLEELRSVWLPLGPSGFGAPLSRCDAAALLWLLEVWLPMLLDDLTEVRDEAREILNERLRRHVVAHASCNQRLEPRRRRQGHWRSLGALRGEHA